MFTTVGLERIFVSAAIFLSLFPSWRFRPYFFTISDLVFCFSLLTILLTRGLPRAPFGMLTAYWFAGFALMMLALVGSSLINGEPTRALIVGAQYVFAFVLLPLIVMGRDREATIDLVKVFAVGVFVANLASIILYYSGYTGGFRFITGNGRLASFAEGPNGHARMVAMAIPLVIYIWLSRQMATYFLGPLLLILLVSLVLASSNNGTAMAVLGVAAFFLVLRNPRYLARAATGIAVCLLLILVWGSYWLPATFEQRVLGAVRSGSIEEAGSFHDRMALMEEALEIADGTLLLGIGVDQYRVHSRYGAPVHNTYLLLWTEGGLPALVGWASLVLIALLGALYVGRRHPLEAATGFAIAAMFVFIGFTTGHVYARDAVVPLYLALALVFASTAEGAARGAAPSGIPGMVDPLPPQQASAAATPPPPMARPVPPAGRW